MELTEAGVKALISSMVAEAAAKAVAPAPSPVEHAVRGAPARNRARVQSAAKRDSLGGKGFRFAQMIRCMALSQMPGVRLTAEQAARHFGYDEVAEAFEVQARGMSEGVFADGGAFVPDGFSSEVIELLQARTVMRQTGLTMVNMSTGSLSIPKTTAAVSATYVGEDKAIAPGKPTLGQIQLSLKKLAAQTVLSNDLIRDAAVDPEVFIRNHLVRQIGLKEDITFITGDGTSYTPKGLLTWTASGNKLNANGTVNTTNVIEDLHKAIGKVEDADVPLDGCVFLMHPRTKRYLQTLRDSQGGFLFRDALMGAAPMLLGYRVFCTSQIPINAGGGTNETKVYFFQPADAILAENTELIVDVQPGGTYEEGGVAKSGSSRDQTVVTVIERHDFALQHDKSVGIIEQVTWGA